MVLKIFLQIISLGLLIYLLADSFLNIGFATSKNNALSIYQKSVIDSTQNIDTVKQKAKDYLTTIRLIQDKHSGNSLIRFWLLVGLIIIQIFLYQKRNTKVGTQ